jgi:hypothetical protein
MKSTAAARSVVARGVERLCISFGTFQEGSPFAIVSAVESPPKDHGMMTKVTRRTALVGLSAFAAVPVRAQSKKDSARQGSGVATLQKAAVFELDQKSGTVKETIQKEQQLIWHLKERQNEPTIQISNISVAFIRSGTGGSVKMSFSCNVSSLGFHAAEEAKLNIIARSKGGAALHSWSLGIPVKCTDKNQTLSPQMHEIPNDVAPNVFTNVTSVEVAEPTGPDFPGVKVQRCNGA